MCNYIILIFIRLQSFLEKRKKKWPVFWFSDEISLRNRLCMWKKKSLGNTGCNHTKYSTSVSHCSTHTELCRHADAYWTYLCSLNQFNTVCLFSFTHLMLASVFSIAWSRACEVGPRLSSSCSLLNCFS